MLELIAFTADPARAKAVAAAGADAVLVDWEFEGKLARQRGADTEINNHSAAELRAVRAAVDVPVICRLNGLHSQTAHEVELAISAGADELLLPMVRSPREVECFLEHVRGRCEVGVLLETVDAVQRAAHITALPIRRAYVGLNDLAIERGSRFLFDAVSDGLVDALRPHVCVPFGLGGLTRPQLGSPIPCRLLLGEIVRLRCAFTFLRRSFWRDASADQLSESIAEIRQAIAAAELRADTTIERERAEFHRIVTELSAAAA